MARRRSEPDDFSSFHYSFLDILACTIGALAFILLLIVLSTQDLVERQLDAPTGEEFGALKQENLQLEAQVSQLEEELEVFREQVQTLGDQRTELQDLATGLREQLKERELLNRELGEQVAAGKELEDRVVALTAELEQARQELQTREEETLELTALLEQERARLAALGADSVEEASGEVLEVDPDTAPLVAVAEAQPTDDPGDSAAHSEETPETRADEEHPEARSAANSLVQRQSPMLPNLERRVILCAPGLIYLGRSRVPLRLSDTEKVREVIAAFMRYYDPQRDVLWWSVQEGAERSHAAAVVAVLDCEESWGEGLRSSPVTDMPRVRRARRVAVDEDGDGTPDVFYLTEPGRWQWTRKYVDTVTSVAGLEEAYSAYDQQTGRWRIKDVDTNGDGRYDLQLLDTDTSDEDYEVLIVDPYDGDAPGGVRARQLASVVTPADAKTLAVELDSQRHSRPQGWARYDDEDGDGQLDQMRVDTNPTPRFWGRLYTEFHRESKRWLRCSIDSNGDGRWDVRQRDTDPSDDTWEELWRRPIGATEWSLVTRNTRDTSLRREILYASPIEGRFWREVRTYDASGARVRAERLTDLDGDGRWDKRSSDVDGDGAWDVFLQDTNADGRWDKRASGRTHGRWTETYLDADRDGRWDEPGD